VRFAGKVTLALVVDLSRSVESRNVCEETHDSGVSSAGLDSIGVGKLDIGRSPDNTLDPEFG
jgi:hypothetical protein